MRPSSCVIDSVGHLVLSTDSDVMCGDGSWSSNLSMSLLIFFVLTTTIVSSDSSTADNDATDEDAVRTNGIQFAPLYSHVLRLFQFLICVVCFGFDSNKHQEKVIVCVMTVSGLMFLWSVFFPGKACNVSFVLHLRAGGCLFVTWTAVVCYLHKQNHDYADEKLLFVGIVIISVVMIISATITRFKEKREWKLELVANGLNDTIGALGRVADVLLVEEAFGGTCDGMALRANKFRTEIENCTSHTAFAHALMKFEENVLFERLTVQFINARHDWHYRLRELQGPKVFITLRSEAELLQSSIVPRSYVHKMSRELLTIILGYNLPEFVVWEIYCYLIDASGIRNVLKPLLTLSSSDDTIRQLNNRTDYGNLCFAEKLTQSAKQTFDVIKIENCEVGATKHKKSLAVLVNAKMKRYNHAGRPMELGEYGGKNNYYCGIAYNCGPTYGPQCVSCVGFSIDSF